MNAPTPTADGARIAAQALSEGLNTICAIQQALRASTWGPDPEWPEALTNMEKALDEIRTGTFRTDMKVTDEDLEQLRRLRELLAGGSHDELRSLTDAVLRRYGLRAAA